MEKWLDGFLLAGKGILLAVKEKSFWIAFLISFFVFGVLMNLLSNGFASFELMVVSDFSGILRIIFDAFLGIFGVGRSFVDWALVFFVAILQGILIGLVVLMWKKKKKIDSENLESAGIAAGLAVLGTGCPTCGTALLTPILSAIFSGGSALAGTVSGIVTLIAVVIAILSIKKVGEEVYVIIVSEKYKSKKKTEEM